MYLLNIPLFVYVRNRRLSNLWGELYAGTTLFYEAIIFYNNAVIQCCKRNISPLGLVGLSGTSDHHCSAILMLFQCVGQTRKGPSLQILCKEFDSVVKQSLSKRNISTIATWRFPISMLLDCLFQKERKTLLRYKTIPIVSHAMQMFNTLFKACSLIVSIRFLT